jgi:hypothetical protein
MEDDQYIRAYSQFRSELKKNASLGEVMAYHWLPRPKRIPGIWMMYFEMVEEHSRELANVINLFLTNIEKLCAWGKVILEYGEEERSYIVYEFVEPLCTICLNLPYAIRSRFIFSVTHLSHQANMAILGTKWKDDLPSDAEIEFSTMDTFATHWKPYKKLKLNLERLSDKKYQVEVNHYRSKYHHRYPSHIEFGLSETVTRVVRNDGVVSYAIGYSKPLQIKDITLVLKRQHEAATKCYGCYQRLVKEQIETILNS